MLEITTTSLSLITRGHSIEWSDRPMDEVRLPANRTPDPPRASPAISVVMPVHDARPYLEESVGSILDQTFRDHELVVLENGSTDGSGELLRVLAERDPRIRLVQMGRRLGSARASNLAVAHARAPVVARMDADDVSHPRRLERQLEVFERHADAALVATLYEGLDASGRRVPPRDRSSLTRRTPGFPFPPGSIAFRRRA